VESLQVEGREDTDRRFNFRLFDVRKSMHHHTIQIN